MLNSLRDSEAGFKKDTNKITVFDSHGKEYQYETKTKILVAKDIVQLIIERPHDKG